MTHPVSAIHGPGCPLMSVGAKPSRAHTINTPDSVGIFQGIADGVGDWRLAIGDWRLVNAQCPMPNAQRREAKGRCGLEVPKLFRAPPVCSHYCIGPRR